MPDKYDKQVKGVNDEPENVILVAFTVLGEDMEEAQGRLMTNLRPLLQSQNPNSPIIEWWIAEDERYDGSDLQSAVFVQGEPGQPGTLTQRTASVFLDELTKIRRATHLENKRRSEVD